MIGRSVFIKILQRSECALAKLNLVEYDQGFVPDDRLIGYSRKDWHQIARVDAFFECFCIDADLIQN